MTVNSQSKTSDNNQLEYLTWGDEIGINSKHTVRISFQNVNGFMIRNTKEERMEKPMKVYKFMKEYGIDTHAMAEMKGAESEIEQDNYDSYTL